jgi:hypothetical protein
MRHISIKHKISDFGISLEAVNTSTAFVTSGGTAAVCALCARVRWLHEGVEQPAAN